MLDDTGFNDLAEEGFVIGHVDVIYMAVLGDIINVEAEYVLGVFLTVYFDTGDAEDCVSDVLVLIGNVDVVMEPGRWVVHSGGFPASVSITHGQYSIAYILLLLFGHILYQ